MIRRVPASAPIHWLIGAFRIFTRHPKAILLGTFNALMSFAGALLFVGITLGALLAMLGFNRAGAHSSFALLAISIPIMLLTMLVPQLLMGGIAHLIHRGETQGTAHPFDAYAGLRKENFLRLSPLVAIQVFSLVAAILLYAVFGGEHYFADSSKYFSALLTTPSGATPKLPPPPEPRWPVALFLSTMALNAFVYLLQLFAPIHAMVGHRSGLAAIVDCLRGFAANAPAMLIAAMLSMLMLFGFMLVVFLALIVATAIAQASPIVGSLLALAIMMALASLGAAFWVAFGYCGWRDVLDADRDDAPDSGTVAL